MTEEEAVGRLDDLCVLRAEAGAWFGRLRSVIQDSPLDSVAEDQMLMIIETHLDSIKDRIADVFDSYVDLLVAVRIT